MGYPMHARACYAKDDVTRNSVCGRQLYGAPTTENLLCGEHCVIDPFTALALLARNNAHAMGGIGMAIAFHEAEV